MVRVIKSRPRKNQSERSDLPCHIINVGYWPCVRSRWLDIGQVLCLPFNPRRSHWKIASVPSGKSAAYRFPLWCSIANRKILFHLQVRHEIPGNSRRHFWSNGKRSKILLSLFPAWREGTFVGNRLIFFCRFCALKNIKRNQLFSCGRMRSKLTLFKAYWLKTIQQDNMKHVPCKLLQ